MDERKLDTDMTLLEAAESGMTIAELFALVGICPDSEQKDSETEPKKVDLTLRITDLLCELGVPSHIKGYRYVRRAIEMVVEDASAIDAVTRELYPTVAEEFSTTARSVERAIRHAVEAAWNRGDLEIMQKYFGNTISNAKGKTTNSEFIAMIAEKLRLEGYGTSE